MNGLDYIPTESFRCMAAVDRSDWVAIRVILACVQSTAVIRAFGMSILRILRRSSDIRKLLLAHTRAVRSMEVW